MKEKKKIVVTYDRMRCDFCGACVAVCPADAIVLWEADLEIDEEKCTGCLRCVYVCPYRALSATTDCARKNGGRAVSISTSTFT